jgi:hypothetical protein
MRLGRQPTGKVLVDNADVRLLDAGSSVDVDDAAGGNGVGDDLADGGLHLDVVTDTRSVVGSSAPQFNGDRLKEGEVVAEAQGLRR